MVKNGGTAKRTTVREGASGETSGSCGAGIAAGAAGGVTAGDCDASDRDSEGPGRRRGEGASGAVEDDSDSGGGSDVPISHRHAVRAARAQQPGGGNGKINWEILTKMQNGKRP